MTASDFTPAQSRIIDAIANSENGTATIENASGVLSSCKALAAKGVIEFEQTEDGIVVSLVSEKKGNRQVWDLAMARNAAGAACARNPEGQLTEVPVNFPRGFYPLMKGQFSEVALWWEWKAVLCDERAEVQNRSAASFRLRAKEAREGASPETLLAKIRARREAQLKKWAEEERAILSGMSESAEDAEDAEDGEDF